MICIKCGETLNESVSYCKNCGAFLGYGDDSKLDKLKGVLRRVKFKIMDLPIQIKTLVIIEGILIVVFFIC